MRTVRLSLPIGRGALAAGLVAVASPALAQTRTGSAERVGAAEVTPYAGVILFGNYLDGPLGTRVRSRPAPVAGAQLGVRVAPGVALVGNVGYSRGDLEVGVPVLGGLRVGSSSTWLYDAGIELRLPSASTISPFLQAGGGAITTRLSGGPVTTTSTNPAFNAGVGLDLGLGRGMGVRLQVKDYIGRFGSGRVAGLEARGDVTHNLAASAGFRLAF